MRECRQFVYRLQDDEGDRGMAGRMVMKVGMVLEVSIEHKCRGRAFRSSTLLANLS
jgi:hypothetical protein